MEANKGDWNSVGKSSKLSQVRESSVLDSYHRKRAASSLVADCTNPQRPPALEKVGDGNDGSEPFGTGGDTHTVPLRGAHVKNLNSHLKSLRNKRKERQKEQR